MESTNNSCWQEIDPIDLDLYNKFMPSESDPMLDSNRDTSTQSGEGTNLADLILEKIALHEATTPHEPRIQGGGAPKDAVEMPAKVVEVYSKYVQLPFVSSVK